jgi:hypothetical protein
MKPVKRVHLDGNSSPLPKLNFNAVPEANVIQDAVEILDDEEPDLVLLSSSSSEDKSQEDHLADMVKGWGSLLRTVSKPVTSVQSVQWGLDTNSQHFDERIHAIDSVIGKCSEGLIKEDCISIWDAITYIHAGLESLGESLKSFESSLSSVDSSMQDKLNDSEATIQSTFATISWLFQDLVTFTKTLSDEQAVLNQRVTCTAHPDADMLELKRDIHALMSRMTAVEAAHVPNFTMAGSSEAAEEIATLKLQLRLLKSRIPIHNILRLGGFNFSIAR